MLNDDVLIRDDLPLQQQMRNELKWYSTFKFSQNGFCVFCDSNNFMPFMIWTKSGWDYSGLKRVCADKDFPIDLQSKYTYVHISNTCLFTELLYMYFVYSSL